MIFYIASNTYQQQVARAIKETEEILVGCECGEELHLYKYIKKNITTFSNVDILVIDISNVVDTEEELIQGFEMLRIMNHAMRLILLAPNRYEGDDLLTKCFQMSIYDIIESDDFVNIKEELLESITVGKQYKDALRFKDTGATEKVIVKNEIKQTVNKVMIGVVGSEKRIGVTHNCIVMANYLRSRGFMVAIAECNQSGAFQTIRESFSETFFDESYFTMNGVDYYEKITSESLGSILGKSYNFIIIDFGDFVEADRITFNKSDVRIIVTGSKPWEIESVFNVFQLSSEETLKGYHYCFNFTVKEKQKDIIEGMDFLSNIHFLNYNADPFVSKDYTDIETILENYMPIKTVLKKKGLFSKSKKEKKG